MESVHIRRADKNDVAELQKIGRKTFTEAFFSGNTEENLNNYLEAAFADGKLESELSNPNSEFYFVELDKSIIGYLKLNFGSSQTEMRTDKSLEIERIYVLKEFYGKGVAQRLYEKAIECAKQKDVDYVWLGVWEENPRAISFYSKNGFVSFDKHIFKLGDDEQTDIMMKLQLKDPR